MHLIVGKEKQEKKSCLEGLLLQVKEPITVFFAENFSKDAFFQEFETLPFLSKNKILIVHDIDQLEPGDFEALILAVAKPNPWIFLYLTASELPGHNKLVKLVEKRGEVHRFKEEKPWEKEKKWVNWLVEESQKEGVKLSIQAATALVQGVDPQMLRAELDKLICFVGAQGEITLSVISLLSTPVHQENLWKFGEALFSNAAAQALIYGRSLLESGMQIFPILAHLRSQCATGLEILAAGKDAIKKFPYLKGNLLEKKQQLFKKYGGKRLQQSILTIFEWELRAKNSATDPLLLLEILITRLCGMRV